MFLCDALINKFAFTIFLSIYVYYIFMLIFLFSFHFFIILEFTPEKRTQEEQDKIFSSTKTTKICDYIQVIIFFRPGR